MSLKSKRTGCRAAAAATAAAAAAAFIPAELEYITIYLKHNNKTETSKLKI